MAAKIKQTTLVKVQDTASLVLIHPLRRNLMPRQNHLYRESATSIVFGNAGGHPPTKHKRALSQFGFLLLLAFLEIALVGSLGDVVLPPHCRICRP